MPALANRMHETFALQIAANRRVSEAYRLAGGKATNANSAAATASKWLSRPNVQDRIAELRGAAADLALVQTTDVIRGLAALAFTDPRELASWGPDGITLTPSAELTPAAASLVREVRAVTTTTTDGKREITTSTVTIRLADRKGALDSLGRILGMFIERQEISGPNKGPIPLLAAVTNLTDRQLAMLIAEGMREQAPA